MFTTAIVMILVLFVTASLLVPFVFYRKAHGLLDRTWMTFVRGQRESTFFVGASRMRWWLRVWGVFALLAFVVLAVFRTESLGNDTGSLLWVSVATIVASLTSCAFVLVTIALCAFIPRALGYQSLARGGVRSLWHVNLIRSNRHFQEELIAHINRSSSLGIVDVTGYKIFGKGAGPEGGLLYDALVEASKIPVFIMLLKPGSHSRDPEGHASVFQSVLASMNMSKDAYLLRLKSTIDAVNQINKDRSAEVQIQVRYYTEKPTLQALVFDNSAMAYPWQPHEDHEVSVPFLEVGKVRREMAGFSLFESFRLHFLRLWSSPVSHGARFICTESGEEKLEVLPGDENPWVAVAMKSESKTVELVQAPGFCLDASGVQVPPV